MPDSLSDWLTSLAPVAVLVVSAVYVAVSQLRGRARRRRGVPAPGVYPGSREQAADQSLAWWRSLSAQQQAAHDAEVLARAAAEEAAGLAAVEAAARAHSLYRS